MKNINRDDIYLISRHSNLTRQEVERALKENVYNDKQAWQQFLKLFLLTLGVGFTVAGIVFFFAYNWASLNKFAKIGLVEALIILTTIVVLIPKINLTLRNIILTGSSILVGVLFAVFGQIYQTGANAYDFFLAWTVFITLWVAVSNFAPLWLLYLILINATFILYADQVAKNWSDVFISMVLFIINTIAIFAAILISRKNKIITVPNWFLNIVSLAAATFATIGIIFGIFDSGKPAFPFLIIITLIIYALGIWHGLKVKSGFYLSIIPFSLIVIISALLIQNSDGEVTFLLVSLFIIISVTLVIKNLLTFQKKWANEK